jgi:8-amino-7-oxononanoate synthase
VLVGENDRTLEFAARLMNQGLMAVALRPPTVPPGRSRVRFSLSAAHAEDNLERAREVIVATARAMGLGL